jgi:pimeloyl-ACP methyl ester carboxylesterase
MPTLPLPSGRKLGYAEYGDPAGRPVFGAFGATARLFRPPDAVTAAAGVRLILPERPGFGLSDPQPGRTLLDWPLDLAALADALGLGRFALVAGSQAGPYGAACAYALPLRLTAVALVSALAPFDAPGVTDGMAAPLKLVPFFANRLPWLLALMNRAGAGLARRNPEGFIQQAFRGLPAVDQQVFRDHPEVQAAMIADSVEIYRQGSAALTQDMRLVCGPWGFRPEAIRARVVIWQGQADPNVPPAMGRYLAQTIPGAAAHFIPGAGHFMAFGRWREILESVAGA